MTSVQVWPRYNASVNLIFCGTPMFAVPTLEALVAAGHRISLAVTQPDRPKGRGMELALTPVKQKALALGLPVAQPERIKSNAEFRAQLESLAPDAIIVVGYGRIIPLWMLGLPRFGNINLHASLLPKYRGAAPIQWAIARGETVTGNTTMLLNEGLDTGDILLQREMPIAPDDTSLTLAPPLAAMGAELTLETLRGLEASAITPRPQDHALHTLAPILTKDDGRVDFARTSSEIYNRLRGFQPWPGAFTSFRRKQFTLHSLCVAEHGLSVPPGTIRIDADRLFVACGDGTAIELLEVQMEGKRRQPAREWANGYQPKPGEKLGE
jgi:methionyl-tRNA formyltransferase